MRQFIIPENILAAILAYLETRPYKEVAEGILALRSLEEAREQKTPEDVSLPPAPETSHDQT